MRTKIEITQSLEDIVNSLDRGFMEEILTEVEPHARVTVRGYLNKWREATVPDIPIGNCPHCAGMVRFKNLVSGSCGTCGSYLEIKAWRTM